MFRKLSFVAVSALALTFCLSVRGQDAPSLGDVARKAQKDKTTKPAAKIITNDDMPAGAANGTAKAPTTTRGAENNVQADAATSPQSVESPAEGFAKMQSMLNDVDSLDRATLARSVLEGHDSDFPGRAAWEERLFNAKQVFVSHGRMLLEKMKQVVAGAEEIKGVQDPNDPRVKTLTARLQQLVRDSQQNNATFQAVVTEGQNLAAQSAGH